MRQKPALTLDPSVLVAVAASCRRLDRSSRVSATQSIVVKSSSARRTSFKSADAHGRSHNVERGRGGRTAPALLANSFARALACAPAPHARRRSSQCRWRVEPKVALDGDDGRAGSCSSCALERRVPPRALARGGLARPRGGSGRVVVGWWWDRAGEAAEGEGREVGGRWGEGAEVHGGEAVEGE